MNASRLRTLIAGALSGLVLWSFQAQADLSLSCALPYTNGKPGKDCTGKHTVEIELSGGGAGTVLYAEVRALDTDGTILGVLPIADGDEAHLKSRISPDDYRLQATKKGVQVDAPIPLVSVTATEGDETVHAYCSNVPYLDLTQPVGQVLNAGDAVAVVMTATGLDPATLQVLVDGVDILAEMGIDPATDLPGSFPDDTVNIGGEIVTISDLVVDVAGVQQLASNTISFTMDGLAAGGHIIYADGERAMNAPAPDPISAACYVDDMEDAGQFAIFGVDITSPMDQEVVMDVPTPVDGVVNHGLPIAEVKLNGLLLDLSSQTFVAGNGMTTADQYEYIIDEELAQTDLRADLDSGNQPFGTLDRGANDLTADATDELGSRAFDNVVFAVGDVQSPEVSFSFSSAVAAQDAQANAKMAMGPIVAQALASTAESIENAFAVGLSAQAVQTLINQKCPAVGQQFATEVTNAISPLPKTVTTIHLDPGPCSCSVNAPVKITAVNIDPTDVSCPITFVEDKIQVSITLPDIEITTTVKDDCGECVLGVGNSFDVNVKAVTKIVNPTFEFDITEGQFLGGPVPEPIFTTDPADVSFPTKDFDQCTFAAVCNFVLDTLVTIFTFGQVDLGIDVDIDATQFDSVADSVDADEVDPIDLGEIKVDETKVEEFGQASLSGSLASVEITPQGFLATLDGDFETLMIDPDIQQNPGAVIQEPPAPTMVIPGSSDATVLLSVDTINQLFASMSESGGLKTQCTASGTTVNDILAVDCEDLDGAAASGYCHGVKALTDCEGVFGANALSTSIKQGICHGVRGDTCSTIPVDLELERTTCSGTPPLNISGTDPVLFCSQQNLPPQFLLVDDGGTPDAIETAVRLNDLSVSIVIDRGTGGSPGDGAADLPTTLPCFGSDSSVNGDCALYSTCLDLNLETTSSITSEGEGVKECPEGVPGFVTAVNDFSILVRGEGVVCGAPQETSDDELVGMSAEDQTVDLIRDNADTFTPPACIEGLDLGGFVTLQDPSIIAVETDGDADTQEYIGITGTVAAP